MRLISPHTPTALKGTWLSAGFRALPAIAVIPVFFRQVPFWAVFTPQTALIFINNATEKLGVL